MNNQELLKHPLFLGIDEKDLSEALALFSASEKSLKKGQQIFRAGTVTEVMGFILEGRIQIKALITGEIKQLLIILEAEKFLVRLML